MRLHSAERVDVVVARLLGKRLVLVVQEHLGGRKLDGKRSHPSYVLVGVRLAEPPALCGSHPERVSIVDIALLEVLSDLLAIVFSLVGRGAYIQP